MIYVVQGNHGMFEDYREWAVAAYTDEALAKRHARLASRWAAERLSGSQASSPFDPDFSDDRAYGPTEYEVVEVPLLDAVPTRRSPMARIP